jgi:hypothetical protein
VDAEALRRAVVRHRDRLALRRRENLQVRRHGRAVAVELDERQPREMREAPLERRPVLRPRHHRPVFVDADPARLVAAVEHAVLGIDRARIEIRARVRGRRMARDQIDDFEPVLNVADAVFERALRLVHGVPPGVLFSYARSITARRQRAQSGASLTARAQSAHNANHGSFAIFAGGHCASRDRDHVQWSGKHDLPVSGHKARMYRVPRSRNSRRCHRQAHSLYAILRTAKSGTKRARAR